MNIVIYICHVDDEVLGAGGLIPQLIEYGHNVNIVYATDATTPRAYESGKRSMAYDAMSVLGVPSENIHFLEFPELHFDEIPVIEFNKAFNELELKPDLIITTDRTDVNQDHHIVFQSSLVLSRSINRQIGLLTAEILSSSEWSDQTFTPHMYIDIGNTIDKKITAMEKIPEELREWPHPRSIKGIRVKAQQRGMEVGLEYAEAFRVVRWFDWNEPLTKNSIK